MPDLELDGTSTVTSANRGWTRRTVLKGAAAGTVLWAAPTVTSLGSRAFAGSAKGACSPTGTGAGKATCQPGNQFGLCGSGGPVGDCFCFQDTSGNEGCYTDFYCGQTTACTQNSDCPSGESCLVGTACGSGFCTTCCGSAANPHVVVRPTLAGKSKKTASGR